MLIGRSHDSKENRSLLTLEVKCFLSFSALFCGRQSHLALKVPLLAAFPPVLWSVLL